jgi:hypothetical protein
VDTLSKTNLVLGFVDYCKHERNMTGKEVQRQVELIKVFFGIYRVEGDLPFKHTEVKRVLNGLVPLSLLEQAELARSNLAKRTYCLTIEEYLQVVLVEFATLNPLIADELKKMRDMTAGAVQQNFGWRIGHVAGPVKKTEKNHGIFARDVTIWLERIEGEQPMSVLAFETVRLRELIQLGWKAVDVSFLVTTSKTTTTNSKKVAAAAEYRVGTDHTTCQSLVDMIIRYLLSSNLQGGDGRLFEAQLAIVGQPLLPVGHVELKQADRDEVNRLIAEAAVRVGIPTSVRITSKAGRNRSATQASIMGTESQNWKKGSTVPNQVYARMGPLMGGEQVAGGPRNGRQRSGGETGNAGAPAEVTAIMQHITRSAGRVQAALTEMQQSVLGKSKSRKR